MSDFLTPLSIAFLISFTSTPLIIYLAKRFGFVDKPERGHPAQIIQAVLPRAGGVPIFLGFLITTLIFLPLDKRILTILLGSFLNLFFGTLDDKKPLSPIFRLLVQIVSAGLIVWAGITFYIGNPLGSGLLYFDYLKIPVGIFGFRELILPAAFILIFWIVWVTNMVNWTKGASQLPGLAVISFLTLAAVALKYQAGNPEQILTAKLGFILAGATLAFLPFNFPPEKMLPGFGGSTLIGFNLAVLAVLSGGKLAAALLVLGVPAIDMGVAIVRRILAGKSPFYPDRGHLYHLMLDWGFTKQQIIFLYWLATAILGFLALNLSRGSKLFAILVVGVGVIGASITFLILLNRRNLKNNREVNLVSGS